MNICIFGDSIAWGAADTEKGGWVERLKTYFGDKYEATIYNLGIPGDTTRDLLKRVESECRSRKPDLIIFAIGINDPWRGDRTPIKKFGANLVKLHKIAKKFTKNVIFIGITPVDAPKLSNSTKEDIELYDATIKKFCLDAKVRFISMKNVLTIKELVDAAHPNSSGHKKIANKIKPILEKYFRKQ